MANMQKWEVDEANCPESYVILALRGDVIQTLANALRHKCSGRVDNRRHGNAMRELGDRLGQIASMIYKSNGVTPQTHPLLAARIVAHDGTEIINEEIEAQVASA